MRASPDSGTGPGAAEPRWRVDPERVHDFGRLVDQLNTLREHGPVARELGCRVSLHRLSLLSEIPRSTLHGYLSGRSVPPADATDRILIALGVPQDDHGRWAEAWGRALAATRGGRVTRRAAAAGWIPALNARVDAALAAKGVAPVPAASVVAVSDVVRVGPDRLMASLDVRLTIRADDDGVDRWWQRVPAGSSAPSTAGLTASRLDGCRLGSHQDLDELGMRVLVLELDECLAAGEVHTLGFRLDYAGARRRLAGRVSAPPEGAVEEATEAMRGFPVGGMTYSLEVGFVAGDQPSEVKQVFTSQPGAEEETVGHLRVGRGNRVSVALLSPSPGLHGIRWTWRSADRRPAP